VIRVKREEASQMAVEEIYKFIPGKVTKFLIRGKGQLPEGVSYQKVIL